jgi:hypothetical protein
MRLAASSFEAPVKTGKIVSAQLATDHARLSKTQAGLSAGLSVV